MNTLSNRMFPLRTPAFETISVTSRGEKASNVIVYTAHSAMEEKKGY